MAIAEGLDLVVSGSKDGTCVLHALFSGKYLRTIRYRHFGFFLLLLARAKKKSRLADLSAHVRLVPMRHGRCESVVERLGLSGRGEIVICTQEDILLYSINGVLLARCPCEDRFTGMQIVPSSSTGRPPSDSFSSPSLHACSLTPSPFSFQTGRPESAFWSPPATTLWSGDWTTLSRFTSSTTISEHRTRLLRPSRRSRSLFSLRRTTRSEGASGHARMKV